MGTLLFLNHFMHSYFDKIDEMKWFILVGYGIVIEKVIFISSSGKKDYALVNEGFTVSCIFLLERDEQFKKIELFKNQNLVNFSNN